MGHTDNGTLAHEPRARHRRPGRRVRLRPRLGAWCRRAWSVGTSPGPDRLRSSGPGRHPRAHGTDRRQPPLRPRSARWPRSRSLSCSSPTPPASTSTPCGLMRGACRHAFSGSASPLTIGAGAGMAALLFGGAASGWPPAIGAISRPDRCCPRFHHHERRCGCPRRCAAFSTWRAGSTTASPRHSSISSSRVR